MGRVFPSVAVRTADPGTDSGSEHGMEEEFLPTGDEHSMNIVSLAHAHLIKKEKEIFLLRKIPFPNVL